MGNKSRVWSNLQKTLRLRWTPVEQAVLDLDKSKEETQKRLQRIWSRADFMNPYIWKWGMYRYNFLMSHESSIVSMLVKAGRLECYLNRIDRIVSYRLLTGETAGISRLLASTTPDAMNVTDIEEEINQLPKAELADAMFAADCAKYPYLLKREQPYVPGFKTNLYGTRRLEYLMECSRAQFDRLVQHGEISKDLASRQDSMREQIEYWVKEYIKRHPAPPMDDPKYDGYMYMTRSMADEIFRDMYLYS